MRAKHFSQTIGAPLRRVYAWCTDFRVDPAEARSPGWERRILEASRTRSVFVDLFSGGGSSPRLAVNVVTLKPPAAWHLDLYGDPRSEGVDYRLTRLGRSKTRLDMTFRVGLGPSEKAGFAQLWAQWAAEIERSYRSRTR